MSVDVVEVEETWLLEELVEVELDIVELAVVDELVETVKLFDDVDDWLEELERPEIGFMVVDEEFVVSVKLVDGELDDTEDELEAVVDGLVGENRLVVFVEKELVVEEEVEDVLIDVAVVVAVVVAEEVDSDDELVAKVEVDSRDVCSVEDNDELDEVAEDSVTEVVAKLVGKTDVVDNDELRVELDDVEAIVDVKTTFVQLSAVSSKIAPFTH